jgi:hypothetical protein
MDFVAYGKHVDGGKERASLLPLMNPKLPTTLKFAIHSLWAYGCCRSY